MIATCMLASAMGQDSLLLSKALTSVEDWQVKRERIKEQVQEHIYGFMPPAPKWEAVETKRLRITDRNILYKELAIQLFNVNFGC